MSWLLAFSTQPSFFFEGGKNDGDEGGEGVETMFFHFKNPLFPFHLFANSTS